MDKIKLPVIYDPELFHIRDADGEFVGLMNVELEISDAALHRRGNQIADAINTAADLSRQVAVLSRQECSDNLAKKGYTPE